MRLYIIYERQNNLCYIGDPVGAPPNSHIREIPFDLPEYLGAGIYHILTQFCEPNGYLKVHPKMISWINFALHNGKHMGVPVDMILFIIYAGIEYFRKEKYDVIFKTMAQTVPMDTRL
jgi:hypothetical protein